MPLPSIVAVVFAVAAGAPAETVGKTQSGWTVGAFGGLGLTILSSEVNRSAIGLNAGYGKPEPRFRLGKIPAQLVLEGYAFNTRSTGIDMHPAFAETVVGGLAYSRWRWARRAGVGAYMDLGIGLSYADRTNRDLDSRLNSTPYFGGGLALARGSHEWLVGLAFHHLSNAGTRGNNQGMNFLLLSVRYRF